MGTGLKVMAAAAVAAVSVTALAADSGVAVLDSERFFLSQAPTASSNLERPQSVNGALYAVIAPLYVTGDFRSIIRLINAGAGTATFTVTVVGSGTATAYGSATYDVPSAAALQYELPQILADANASQRAESDEQYSLYIQSTSDYAGYQHVTLNEPAHYFENAAICKYPLQEAVRELSNQVVLNSIHTSKLADLGYPAQIELHNYANAPVTYRFYIRNATTGELINQMDFPTRANASYTIPWSDIENTIGFVPGDQYHANLVVTDPSGAPPAILLGQAIINESAGVMINMTNACAVKKPTSDGGGDGGLPGGGITY